MSLIGSQFGNVPGMGTVIETFEQAITWGPAWGLRWWNAYISANAVDAGNTPTWKLRPGLVMGIITATGQWTNYSPTAIDGSQIAVGVLAYGLRMQDVLSGLNTAKFYAVIVGGGVKGANLLGLDNMARAQMTPRFVFDDNLLGNSDFEFLGFTTKTANYQLLTSDNFIEFNNIGAVGAVTFTLPPIGPGYKYGFRVVADQNMTIASSEGANIVGFNNAVANTVAFSTGGARVGGGLIFYTNQAGTKWFVENNSAGANTVTTA